MSRVLNLLLAHQSPEIVAKVLKHWSGSAAESDILVAYGGDETAFAALGAPNKIFIPDPRLRTIDHSRERQSYAKVFAASSEWLRGRDFTHVFFAEFDHLPLIPDLAARLLERMREEKADVLAHSVRRVDATSWHHYLYHAKDSRFHAYWNAISRRADKRVVLAMLGTGSFWTREAFDAVAAAEEPFPMYLEIVLPTLAHHLGFRVRDLKDQNRFVRHLGDMIAEIPKARSEGAWTIHPVKNV